MLNVKILLFKVKLQKKSVFTDQNLKHYEHKGGIWCSLEGVEIFTMKTNILDILRYSKTRA